MYLIRQKGTKKFKEISSISEFSQEMFENYELFLTTPITAEQYAQELKNRKAAELIDQLKALGIDVAALLGGVKKPSIPTQSNELPAHMSADLQSPPPNNPAERPSKVKNPKTGEFYRMSEIKSNYELFRTNIEKDIPEIEFSDFNEKGIVLSMSEARPDLPRILPNVGIPVIQIVSERIPH